MKNVVLNFFSPKERTNILPFFRYFVTANSEKHRLYIPVVHKIFYKSTGAYYPQFPLVR